MAVPGVFSATDAEILESIKKCQGRVTAIAKDLGIAPSTVYNRLNGNPELQKALDEARKTYVAKLCDAAEDTLYYAIAKRDDDLANALKSSFYTLNNQGRDRGYAPINGSDSYNEKDKNAFNNLMIQINQYQKLVTLVHENCPELLSQIDQQVIDQSPAEQKAESQ